MPCEVVATWGNHDFVGEHDELVPPDLPWTLLVDEETTVSGLRIHGTPWVPNLPRWAFNAREEGLQARADLIPAGLDILMSHGPPQGIGDFIPGGSKYGNIGETNVGDLSLNDAIKRARPRFVVCGHIHEARGLYHVPFPREPSILDNHIKPKDIIAPSFDGECIVMNVAAVDGLYDLYEYPFSRIYGI